MSEKSERIGIKLNRLTVIALKEFKVCMYGDSNIPVPDSFLIEEAYKKISSKIDSIDWVAINDKDTIIPNVTNSDDPSTALRTTLAINIEILEDLKKLQNKMIESAGSRIFFSYVIKTIMFSAILECNDLLDNYLI
ncbi:MAG: hypothetical protein GX914_06350 [Erysipelotrichia bacterium]|nr:hypothetical protein [Erysipelotrichia bacterium]